MSRLLEILGRGITVDTAELIWFWLDAVKNYEHNIDPAQTERLDKIVNLVSNKKMDAAEEQLRLYLFDNPACVRGRLAAAAIHITKNRLEDALEELNSVYMRQPNNTMALYALGHCYERLGKESEAVEFYQDCLKFKNYLQLPRQRLAAIYFKNGQLKKTTQEYELLRKEYPDDISTLVTLGHLYIASGQYAKAIETFNTAILIHPDNFHPEDEDIDRLISEGRLNEALEHVEQLLKESPEKTYLGIKRAEILSMLGDETEAILQYQEAIRIFPDSLEATIKLGTQHLQMHELQLAAHQFNRASEINDQIVDAYIGLAIAQKSAGNTSDALAVLSLAAAIQPNSSLLFAETAMLQFKIGMEEGSGFENTEPSPELIEAVIKAHRDQISYRQQNPDLHYRLGVLMMSVGRIKDAIRSFQTTLEINPTYMRAKSKLAVCLYETNQKEPALGQIVGPECFDKDTLELHYKTALLYCNKVKFASSLINLERYMEENFTCPDTTINISVVLQNLGILDRATAMWDNLSDTTNRAISMNWPFSPGVA